MSSLHTTLDLIRQQKIAAKREFQTRYPHLFSYIQSAHLLDPPDQSVPQFDSKIQDSAIKITLEEYENTIQKLKDLVVLPPAPLDVQLGLYLEQQIAELTGVEVTTVLETHQLPQQMGIIKSLPHQKCHPTDTLTAHIHVLEAGFSEKRSRYGWQYDQNDEYSLSLPLMQFPIPEGERETYKQWYKYRKMLVINPIERKAVVAKVTDIQFFPSHKYQFGGSPELIRAVRAWSPQSLGRVLLFYIPKNNTHPCGPVAFKNPTV